jgi:coiled-coil domain-containing protein 130
MSSLKAARADNFYHPPDWDPRKQSRAELAAERLGEPKWKAHPLRERAKRLDEGILTVRFEMPFDVRCTGCNNRIGKGVRFNAQKQCVGKYFSTKIWSFTMMCAVEDGTWRTDRKRNAHYIEVRTDPKAGDYVVESGAKRVGDLDLVAGAVVPSAEERGVEELGDPDERVKRASDPFYNLEHAPAAKLEVRKRQVDRIGQLEHQRDTAWRDDYATSQLLRSGHRTRRKEEFDQSARALAKGLRLTLLPAAAEDAAAVAGVRFGESKRRRDDAARREKRLRLLSGSIFGDAAGATSGMDAGAEARRLKALQLRRARDMKITNRSSPAQQRPSRRQSRHIARPAAAADSTGGGGGNGSGQAASNLVAYSDTDDGSE